MSFIISHFYTINRDRLILIIQQVSRLHLKTWIALGMRPLTVYVIVSIRSRFSWIFLHNQTEYCNLSSSITDDNYALDKVVLVIFFYSISRFDTYLTKLSNAKTKLNWCQSFRLLVRTAVDPLTSGIVRRRRWQTPIGCHWITKPWTLESCRRHSYLKMNFEQLGLWVVCS